MRRCPQGVHAFLRAYYHVKSADWAENRPFPLRSWAAEELAKMPTYYIMDLARDMAETVAPEMPSPEAIAACRWLPDEELRVYSEAFARTGFQGGLNWYRCATDARYAADLQIFSGRTIDVPSIFIAGERRLGAVPEAGAAGDDAGVGVHANARLPLRGRRRALGAAGAAGGDGAPAARFPRPREVTARRSRCRQT